MIGLDFGIVRPRAIAQGESPGVPGASDAAVVDPAGRERCTLVGAKIIQGVILSGGFENGDHPIPYGKRAPFVLGYVLGLGDPDPLCLLRFITH